MNGLTVLAEDPGALKDKIMYVIDHNEDMDAIRAAGRTIYELYFSKSVFEPKVQALAKQYCI